MTFYPLTVHAFFCDNVEAEPGCHMTRYSPDKQRLRMLTTQCSHPIFTGPATFTASRPATPSRRGRRRVAPPRRT
jgi:hypothetical protein